LLLPTPTSLVPHSPLVDTALTLLVVPTLATPLVLTVPTVPKLLALLSVVPKAHKDLKALMLTDKLPNTLMLNKLLAVTTMLLPSSLPLNKLPLELNKPVVNSAPDTLSVVPKEAKEAKDPKPLPTNSLVPTVLTVPKPPKLLVPKVLTTLLPNKLPQLPTLHTTVTSLDTLHSLATLPVMALVSDMVSSVVLVLVLVTLVPSPLVPPLVPLATMPLSPQVSDSVLSTVLVLVLLVSTVLVLVSTDGTGEPVLQLPLVNSDMADTFLVKLSSLSSKVFNLQHMSRFRNIHFHLIL
jgi:hypothetical protein